MNSHCAFYVFITFGGGWQTNFPEIYCLKWDKDIEKPLPLLFNSPESIDSDNKSNRRLERTPVPSKHYYISTKKKNIFTSKWNDAGLPATISAHSSIELFNWISPAVASYDVLPNIFAMSIALNRIVCVCMKRPQNYVASWMAGSSLLSIFQHNFIIIIAWSMWKLCSHFKWHSVHTAVLKLQINCTVCASNAISKWDSLRIFLATTSIAKFFCRLVCTSYQKNNTSPVRKFKIS